MLRLIRSYWTVTFVILSVGFASCNSGQHRKSALLPEDIYPEPDSVVQRKIAESKEIVLKSNDRDEVISYYNYLQGTEALKYGNKAILAWSLLVAHKHNYANAYLWVYYGLTDFDANDRTRSLKYLDKETRDMALKYLKKSIELGDYGGAYDLAQYYFEGKYLPQDSVEGKRLMSIPNKYGKPTRYGPKGRVDTLVNGKVVGSGVSH